MTKENQRGKKQWTRGSVTDSREIQQEGMLATIKWCRKVIEIRTGKGPVDLVKWR